LKQAVDLICTRKRESNVENSVGLISMKYTGPEISLHLTEERRWNSALAKIALSHGRGSIDITEAIRKARLALKHKRNSKQEKRIIAIVCSPITSEVKTLMRTAKDLKKNGLSLDIICFGVPEEHDSETVKKLRDMVAACNKADSSHFVHLSEETHANALHDVIVSSAIIQGFAPIPVQAQQQAPAAAAPGGEHIEGMPEGIDPNTDPELYHAIRLSIEMHRQQMENDAANQEAPDANGGDAAMENAEAVQAPASSDPAPAPAPANDAANDGEEEEDDELLRAIALSMQEEEGDDIDAEDLQAALAMSMADETSLDASFFQDEDDNPASANDNQQPQEKEQDDDREFLANLMAEMPGVDAEEIDIDAIMESINEDEPKKDDDKTS